MRYQDFSLELWSISPSSRVFRRRQHQLPYRGNLHGRFFNANPKLRGSHRTYREQLFRFLWRVKRGQIPELPGLPEPASFENPMKC
jgi:hypothetical protein